MTLWRGRPGGGGGVGGWGELFDLENDPRELTNLYHKDADLRGRLLEQFMQNGARPRAGAAAAGQRGVTARTFSTMSPARTCLAQSMPSSRSLGRVASIG